MGSEPLTAVGGALLRSMQATGIAWRPAADGSWHATLDRVELANVRMPTPFGMADVLKATLTGVEVDARLRPGPAGGAFELRRLAAERAELDDVELTVVLDPSALPALDRLEPIGGMQGLLRVYIRDATWVIDAEITMPIAAGRIDFNRVVVEHVGPNSAMGLAPGGVYVEAPSLDRTELIRLAASPVPGARYETRGAFGHVSDRGSLDLQGFVQALLASPAGQPLARLGGRDVEAMLDRTKLNGELQLGDGALGTPTAFLVLADRALSHNRLSLSGAVAGQRVIGRLPDLAASRATFELLGRQGTTGPVTASIEFHVTGLSGAAPSMMLMAHRMTVQRLVVGPDPLSPPAGRG